MTCCNVNSLWVFVTSHLRVFVGCYNDFWMEKKHPEAE